MSSMLKAMRNGSPTAVSICVPCRDQLHSGFAYDLARLVQASAMQNLHVQLHFNCGTIITNQREALLREALASGNSHLLWLDSDMMFPPDALQRLLSHDLPLVAANYATRSSPHKSVAYRDVSDWSSYVVHGPLDPQLMEVQAVGMGCMLLHLDTVRAWQSPIFELRWQPLSGDHLGEDFVFCGKLRAAGVPIMLDSALSRDLLHLGTKAFGHGSVRRGLL